MAELITIGEPLVTYVSKDMDRGLVESLNWSKIMGGAELNVMVGATRLGHTTEYVTQVGTDPFGQYVINEIGRQKVGNSYISTSSDYWTGHQLKELVSQGDPATFNYRKGSAASQMEKTRIDEIDFSEVKWAHLSGIFPGTSLTARETFRYFAEQLIARGIHTTFDPNLRPPLWESEEVMRQTVNDLAKQGEIVLPGINEGKILMGSENPEAIADFYLSNGGITHTVIVKLGAAGAYVKTKSGESYTVPGFKVDKIVDTVGAGDGFAVGLLTAQLEGKNLKESVRRACAIGAMAIMTPGDNDGYPTAEQLEAFYQTQK
ncbi:MAG: sugar kinase [Streptococcaceae bacterium]|jgi:2-dehydro-3-deoxygluconokinase|nr:sugar kinase [Streptococcaceae bacterium]